MPKTSKERGRTPTVIEFDTSVLERLRREARAQQRSVAFLVRRIVKLYYNAIDAPDDEATLWSGATRERSTSFVGQPMLQKFEAPECEPLMGILPSPPADDAENMSASRERIAHRRKEHDAEEKSRIDVLRVPFGRDAE
jgi:hypothetical protein